LLPTKDLCSCGRASARHYLRFMHPVSWFRSSPYHRYQAPRELRNQNDTGNQYVDSVLRFRNSPGIRYRDHANFGIGTL